MRPLLFAIVLSAVACGRAGDSSAYNDSAATVSSDSVKNDRAYTDSVKNSAKSAKDSAKVNKKGGK